MIQNISISAQQKDVEIDDKLKKYIEKKIGRLDRHMKRRNRQEARADVKVRKNNAKGGRKYTVEVIFHIPGSGAKLNAAESTMNVYAAIDILEQKLQNQLKKFKEKNNPDNDRRHNSQARRALSKFFRR